MPSPFSRTSSFTKVVIIIEFVLVAYLLYSLTKNIYHSYQVDKYIEVFEAENAQIEEENRQKTEDYLYFTSEEYIDKIAKQNLGLINPGEEIIVVSPEVLSDDFDIEAGVLDDYDAQVNDSNANRWWQFFFED